MTKKLQNIPDPGNDINSLMGTVRALVETMNVLSRNENGHAASQVFATAGGAGDVAAIVSAQSAGASATIQFTLARSASVLVAFQYYGTVAGAAGNLTLSLDGNVVSSVPLPVVAGQVYPQCGFAALTNVGNGPHSLTVQTDTGLSGLSVAAIAANV
jgi:hypothetical protein